MAHRLLSRPTPVVLGVLALGAALSGLLLAYLERSDTFAVTAILVGTVGAIIAITLLPALNPAYPIVLGMLAAVFSGNWGNIGIPLGLDRPLLLYGILGVLVRGLPDLRRGPPVHIRPVHWLLLVVALYAIGSATFAGTATSAEPVYALLDRLGIIGFLLFLVAPSAFATSRSRDVLLGAFVGLGAYLGLTALFETVGASALVYPKYINDPTIGITADRARGPFVEAAANGLALYACAVAAAMGLYRWREGRTRAVCAAVLGLCAIGILFTLTRQIWIGAAVATATTLVVVPMLRPYLLPVIATSAATVVVALAVIPGLDGKVAGRAEQKSPVYDRLNSNRAALRMIQDRPLLGFGFYTFAESSPPFLVQSATYPLSTVSRPHNVFLGNGAELGLIGATLALAGVLIALGGGVLRRGPAELDPWRAGLIAIAISWLIVANFTPLGYAFPNHLIWLWAGVVGAGMPARTPRPQPAPAGGDAPPRTLVMT